MPPSAHRLAAALATRLQEVVPRRFRVRAEDAAVCLYEGDEPWSALSASAIVEDEDGRTLAERARCAADAVMSGVQDCVATALREPWPRLPGGEMALPDARCDGVLLHLGYGSSEREPAVSLPPIAVADLLDD